MRGENIVKVGRKMKEPGTSPRARGKPPFFAGLLVPRGNIPACAGKTHRQHSSARTIQEHPRVRGENKEGLTDADQATGTSPRARGKLF